LRAPASPPPTAEPRPAKRATRSSPTPEPARRTSQEEPPPQPFEITSCLPPCAKLSIRRCLTKGGEGGSRWFAECGLASSAAGRSVLRPWNGRRRVTAQAIPPPASVGRHHVRAHRRLARVVVVSVRPAPPGGRGTSGAREGGGRLRTALRAVQGGGAGTPHAAPRQ